MDKSLASIINIISNAALIISMVGGIFLVLRGSRHLIKGDKK